MEGRNPITTNPDVLNVLESQNLHELFGSIFNEPALTFDYKWLRGMHGSGFTGAHMDTVYMSKGSQRLLTCWIPIGMTPPEMGTLAVCEGSHNLESFKRLRDTYGKIDVEDANLNGTGWFSESASEITKLFGGQWKTATFEPGDVLIFSLHTLHMSTTNLTDKVRISCDVRWQPKSEPADQRFASVKDKKEEDNAPKFGVYAQSASPEEQSQKVTMS